MNKQELNESLMFLYEANANIQLIIYAKLKDQEEEKKLNIIDEDLPALTEIFLSSIRKTILVRDSFSVIPLSTADERGNTFYEYDLELPQELTRLKEVIGNDELDRFSLNDDEFESIENLIIVLGNNERQVSLYKKLNPIEVIGRGGYLLWKSNDTFKKFDEKLLRISSGFQALSVDGSIIINELSLLERGFGFNEIIKREAVAGIEAIKNLGILENIEVLEELIDDISFSRKLTKVAKGSPVVLKAIPNHQIIAFAKVHPAVRGKIKLNNDESLFSLDTKVSRNLFVKILNDDFLTSELTKSYYDSLAKDHVLPQE